MVTAKFQPFLIAALLCAACGAQQSASPGVSALDGLTKAREKIRAIEAASPGNSVDLANALHDLVSLELYGDFRDADLLPQVNREAAVALDAAGPRSKSFVYALSDTAEVYTMLSRASEARPFAERAFEIAQTDSQDADTRIAAADALAFVCNSLGDFPCALRANETAIAVERKAGSDHDWELASTLANLGDVKEQMGDIAGAGEAIEESLAAALRSRPNDPQIAIIESDIGAYYLRIRQFSKAMPHLKRAIEIATQAYGPDSTLERAANANLADIYTRTGEFSLAWTNYELAIGNRSENVDRLARIRVNYARSLASGGSPDRAIDQGLLAAQMNRENFVLQARTLPERQALVYAQHRALGLDAALSVLIRHPDLRSADIYQEVVRSRALVAEEMARREKNLNADNDPKIAQLLNDLNQARADLLAVEQATPDKNASGDVIMDATARVEKVERALAERSAAIRSDERLAAVQLDDLRQHLPLQSALISYVAFQRFAVDVIDPARANKPSYMAFVLRRDSPQIRIFDLGEAEPIEYLVTRARAAADAEAHGSGLGSIRNERVYREAGESLRQLIWDPLQSELRDVRLALVVPDGMLGLFPFSSLPSGKGYLVEHGPVVQMLSSERDLLPADQGQKKFGLLAIGSPTFELAENKLPPSPIRGATPTCGEFGRIEFHSLPGTAAEIDDIASIWQRWNAAEPSQLVTGDNATLDRFLTDSPHSRVLHVATHAFLLDKSCGDGNPLLHSGLVFAGGNRGGAKSIITAQQIASLDLSGVDWAVLSACNTGNGELRDGEGVLGLQRAFRVAGAHSVIMSLWPVDDDATREFMHELYAQRLGHHATTADAVWNSARTVLLERRAAGKSTHPWYWAGFVSSGRWE